MEDEKIGWFRPNKDLTKNQIDEVQAVNNAFETFAKTILWLPEGRRKAMVFSKLEEAAMLATKTVTHG